MSRYLLDQPGIAAPGGVVLRLEYDHSFGSASGLPAADEQLDALEAGADVGLYNAVLDSCELIFRFPQTAQSMSTAVTTRGGIALRYPVPGFPPYKVFWTSKGPRVEAVFPHR